MATDEQKRGATMVTRFLHYPRCLSMDEVSDTIERHGGKLNEHPEVIGARVQMRMAQRALLHLVEQLAEEDDSEDDE